MLASQFYVTNDGLAAAMASPDLLTTMRGILTGNAHPMTVRSLHKRGLIAQDKRGGLRTDHNALILTGAVDRVRDVLLASSQTPTPEPPAKGRQATYVLQAAPEPSFSPTVEKVRAVLKEFEGKEFGFKDLIAHPVLKDMNPGTLRWSIQVLRRAGICQNKVAA